jgi:chloramphenicol O-acetyltransferase type A
MKEIDLNTWKRKEHFNFFRKMDLPFYNVNVNVDITGIREVAKVNNVSFNSLLIFLTVRSMNKIENTTSYFNFSKLAGRDDFVFI